MTARALLVHPDGAIDEVDADGRFVPRYPLRPDIWAELQAAGYPTLRDDMSPAECVDATVDGGQVTVRSGVVGAVSEGVLMGAVTPLLAAWLAENERTS